jgi:hypothetical protein
MGWATIWVIFSQTHRFHKLGTRTGSPDEDLNVADTDVVANAWNKS